MTINKTINQGKYTLELYTNDKDQPLVKVYNNNAKKAYNRLIEHIRFMSEEHREKWVADRIQSIKAHEERKAQRKAERLAFKNPAKVGDVLVSSWGYDQTNIDYYQVTEVKGKSVKLRPISKSFIGSEPGSDIVKPAVGSFKGEEQLRRVSKGYSSDTAYYVRLSSFEHAYPTDPNKADRQTDAYSGH